MLLTHLPSLYSLVVPESPFQSYNYAVAVGGTQPPFGLDFLNQLKLKNNLFAIQREWVLDPV